MDPPGEGGQPGVDRALIKQRHDAAISPESKLALLPR